MTIRTTISRFAFVAVVLASPVRADAGDTLAEARDLYASAAYDDALKVLNGLPTSDYSRAERQVVGLYRALCLFALGRTADAGRTIEDLIAADPLYRPAVDDIGPRVRNAFTEARKRLLPAIIQQRYTEGKEAFNHQDFSAAAETFKQVLDALADPDMAQAAAQSPLSDLRMLATDFHDLSMKAAAPPSPPPAPVVASAPPPPVPHIYETGAANVIPPVMVRQVIPPFPGRAIMQRIGVLEMVVNEAGAVESATMRVSIEPQYDRSVMAATKTWQYEPATLNGAPVKYLKRVQVVLKPTP